MGKWIASLCLSELFFYLLCSRINISNAAGMEGATLEGDFQIKTQTCIFTALAVVGPKTSDSNVFLFEIREVLHQ